MFPETPVARACFPNASQFNHNGKDCFSVNFVSEKQHLLLLHGRNISCFHATWKHGKKRKQLRKHVSSFCHAFKGKTTKIFQNFKSNRTRLVVAWESNFTSFEFIIERIESVVLKSHG